MASSLSARTVYLKLHPTARTFAERREVLRVLERFGEVTMFKSYKYSFYCPTPNTFLALFASESAAKELINASPIRYTMISYPTPPSPTEPTPEPVTSEISKAIPPRTSQDPSSKPSPNAEPAQDQNQEQPENQTVEEQPPEPTYHPYQLHAYPSLHNHAAYLTSPRHSPYHGPWKPILSSQSYISSSLSLIIPPSIYSAGLMDWEVRQDPEDGDTKKVKMGEVEKWEGVGFWYRRREERRVERGREVPRIMRGLRSAWEGREGEREREVDP